jgi:hypothetical protein
MSSSHEFWWNQPIPHAYELLAYENEMVMDEPIPFNKPNKKVRSEKTMDHLVPQTKHTLSK